MVMDLAGGGLIISSLLLLLSLHLCSSSTDTLNFNQSLTDGEVLVSNGETYTLGFFSLENSSSTTNRYLGIWYTKISFPSFVWVANGDNPINGTSGSLSIDHRGDLVLREGGRNNPTPLWIATGGGGNSSTAALLDEGNLVLFGGDHGKRTVLWQSFEHLADTIFPNMKFGSRSNRLVRSWKSPEDPATGDWTFEMDENGLPQMTLRDNTGTRRWRIGPWNGIRWNGIHDVSIAFILNTSIVNGSSHTTTFTWANQNPAATTTMFVQFGGYLVLSTWQSRIGRWADVASFPNEPCDNYGSCGPNGNCDPYYNVGKSECRCLPGFEPKFPDEWDLNDGSGGCRSTRNSTCGNGEGFVKLENAKVPDVTRARLGAGLDLKMCGEECLKDCSCTAYASYDLTSGDGCLMFYGDLMDTRVFNDGGQDLYVRVDAIELAEHMKGLKGHKPKKVLATALMAMGAAIVLGIIIACCLLRRKIKGSRGGTKHVGPATEYDSENENMYEQKDSPVRFFDVNDIFVATGNFSLANKLGQGGFGSVYKGLLPDGQEVAVKRLSQMSRQGIREFKNEVKLMSKLQHKNLARLLGCCINENEKMLVYEYLPNKSLDFFIFEKTKVTSLDWKARLDIIIGIARGLMYLHQDSRLKIIHRDLKPNNVLLDAAMNPKISDFGMARLFGDDQMEANTSRVMGTYGYMSPEYAMNGLYSTKSDVFSFGVLTLEIVSGMRSNHCYQETSSFSLIDHVWALWREGTLLSVVDSSIMGESFSADQVTRCIHIGLLCVQESPADRPAMSDVVIMFSNATSLPSPKKLAFIIQPKYEDPDSKTTARFALPSNNQMSITTMEAR